MYYTTKQQKKNPQKKLDNLKFKLETKNADHVLLKPGHLADKEF